MFGKTDGFENEVHVIVPEEYVLKKDLWGFIEHKMFSLKPFRR